MDFTMGFRILCGVLAVVILLILVYRLRKKPQ
jgi:hypothetical protein